MGINIKEIGKELMGKSLNSFHRKTGLTQLEKNNEMQDGILDGILSQIDDAYIEKTEQSNIIHLEGSGDGVVVVDSIEGNTLVNLRGEMNTHNCHWILNNGWWELDKDDVLFLDFKAILKPNSIYTVVYELKSENNCGVQRGFRKDNGSWIGTSTSSNKQGLNVVAITTTNEEVNRLTFHKKPYETTDKVSVRNVMILEGDWTNREIPASYFEGLQSSFEEKVNSEGKYEIEILSKNRTLSHEDYINHVNSFNIVNIKIKKSGNNLMFTSMGGYYESNFDEKRTLKLLPNTKYGLKVIANVDTPSDYIISGGLNKTKVSNNFYEFTTDDSGFVAIYPYSTGTNNLVNTPFDIIIEPRDKFPADKLKQNKIKLLLDEPLRKVDNNYKDRLCIKDGRLVVERKCGIDKNLHLRNWTMYTLKDEYPDVAGFHANVVDMKVHGGALVCDKFKCMERDMHPGNVTSNEEFLSGTGGATPYFKFNIKRDKLSTLNAGGFKTYLQQNPVTVVYPLLTPIYEEVLNEYGEPILLEGYENGTIYIDSTIVPTTTVRYTPKMEYLKTLKAVNHNNIMLTDDINNNIIDYMMNVDLMITEKEMKNKKIRRIGEKDMTSMQKRTFDMLKRLIKGKTLTEQECKDRVVLYLSADKITSEQAEELMIYISEIYA